MTLIDDYSRKVWVIILKHKSEAFQKFKEWLTVQENKKGITRGGKMVGPG